MINRVLFLAAVALCVTISGPALGQERFVPADEQGRASYIVTFSERGLLDTHRGRGADARSFDFNAAATVDARVQMQRQQADALRRIASRIGRAIKPTHHYLVTSNGMAMRLTPDEAKQVAALPGVEHIRRDRLYELDTYRGPSFIGADTIWDGTNTPGNVALRGEGVVIAILDSGIPASAHDSFANDPSCGHGTSQPDKVLSSLDCSSTDGNGLCNGSSPGDTVGHGSHVASTAGGNLIDGSASPSPTVPGNYTEISGVAHCASIRSYKVCPDSCPGTDIQAGMDSVLIHGDASAMNFSISGGRSPWADNDRKKLDVVDAGVFVAASAGNTSALVTDPIGAVNHLGPWVMSVAASTRDTNTSGTTAQGDVLANFSLRGPTPSPYADLQKPNITAPGVQIYAAVPGSFDFYSGTSMSSPHVAGAGALVAQANPDWTAMEIKSALQMTSFNGGFKENGSTPWDPDDVGSGRVDLTQAALAGVVMHETAANLEAADPNSGGDLKTLNLPSMRNLDCTPSCTFTRTVRNTLTTASSWTAAGTSNGGEFSVDVSPATFAFTGDTNETRTLTITVTAQTDTTGSIAFGAVTLSEAGDLAPDARLTIAMSGVGGPDIAVSPADFSFSVDSGSSDSATLQIDSIGTEPLDWTIDEATPDSVVFNSDARNRGVLPDQEVLNIPGFTVTPGSPVDFDIPAGIANSGDVTGLTFEGDVTAIGASDWASDMMMNVTPPAGTPVFSVGGFDAPVNDWDFQGGGSTNVGTYASTHNDIFGPGGTPDAGNWNFEFLHDWSDGNPMTWDNVTVTLIKQIDVCQNITDITWLSVDTTAGSIPAGNSQGVQVSIDATGLGAGTYSAQLCINSNAAGQPVVQVPVTLEVTDPPGPTEARLNGTVSSLGYCDGAPTGVGGANVEIVGQSNTYNATTSGSGAYSINVPASESPVTLNVAPANHLPGSVSGVTLVAQNTYTKDLDLRLDAPCASASETSISVTLNAGTTASQSLTLNNGGAAQLNWSVDFDNVRGVGQPVELVGDGSFEAGSPNPEWTEASDNYGSPLCDSTCTQNGDLQPRTGDWWIWFGGADDAVENGSMAQTITVPDDAVTATLTFYLRMPAGDEPASLDVSLGGDNLFAVTEADASSYTTYQEVSIDVMAYADGTPRELLFSAFQDNSVGPEEVTNFFVDDVSLVASVPVPCQDLPGLTWLSASPTGGTIAADDSDDILLDFDASALGDGDYSGSVCLASDDTENALIAVPVIMTVEGDIFGDRFEPPAP